MKVYNKLVSEPRIATMTGRVIKHPTIIKYHSIPGATSIGKKPMDFIGVDIESDYKTGETKLIGCFDGSAYWFYEDSFLENLRQLVKLAAGTNRSIVYWSRFDPLQFFRILLQALPEAEREFATKSYEKISGVWNRRKSKWESRPVLEASCGSSKIGVAMAVRGNLQLFTRPDDGGRLMKAWTYNVAPFYAEALKETGKRFLPWYSKMEESDHLISGDEWLEVRRSGARREGVLKSNELDARAAYALACKIGEDFARVCWGWYPKNLISVGALGRAAIVAYAQHEHEDAPKEARQALVLDDLRSIGIHYHLAAWKAQMGEETFKDFYSAIHEVYKGAKIECYGYGYWEKAFTADLTQAYPATEVQLLDLRGSKVDTGFGNPPDETATDYVLIRGMVHIPDGCEYHPFLIRKPGEEENNICPTGDFMTTYWKDERDLGVKMGISFEDEIWYRIKTEGKLSLFAGCVQTQVNERMRLKKLKDPTEFRLKQQASSDYGIRFEATPIYKLELATKSVITDIARGLNTYKEVLKGYHHKVNLESVAADLKSTYGDDYAKIRALWGGGKLQPDVVARELETQGIYIEEINPASIMIRIHEMYRMPDKAVQRESITEEKIIFDGLRAGDYFEPMAASRITMKTRCKIAEACLSIVKSGGRPIFAQTDSIEWEGSAADLDPAMWRAEKTLGYFEKPSEVRDLISLGAGRYEYKAKDPETGEWELLTAKSRGVHMESVLAEDGIVLSSTRWRESLKNLVGNKIMLTMKVLVTPGLTNVAHHVKTVEYDKEKNTKTVVEIPLGTEDIGRIIEIVKELDPISGRKKRYIELPRHLESLATKHYWSAPVHVCGGVAPGEGDIDDTLPDMRKELQATPWIDDKSDKKKDAEDKKERRGKYFLLRRHRFDAKEAASLCGRSWGSVMELIKARDV